MIEKIIATLAGFIIAVISKAGYLGVLLLMAIESACIPLPSEIIMPFAGFLVYKGQFNLLLAATAGAIGCNVGSVVAYEIGHYGGRPLIERYGSYIFMGRHELDLAERFFKRFGATAVFIGRLLPVIRTFIALPAGVAKMPRLRFHVYTFMGSWPWCFALAWIGMKLGERWDKDPRLKQWFHRLDAVIILLLVAGIVYFVWSHWKGRVVAKEVSCVAGSKIATPKLLTLAGPQFRSNPYPFYARLRKEHPVIQVVTPDGHLAWLITRYDDALNAFKDKRLSKDIANLGEKPPWVPKYFEPLARNMLDLDDPDHARLRTLVHKAFTPKLIETLRASIETITKELIESAKRRGRMDLIAEFALPLPVAVISQMLGIPKKEQDKFHRWSKTIVSSQSSKVGALKAIPSVISFLRYIRRLVRLRQVHPEDDLTTAMVQAEEAGDRMNADEMLAMIFLLLIAGHETTVNLIGNGMLALFTHPEQMEKLRGDSSLVASAVEEMLRFDSPLEMATERYAAEEVGFSGTAIPAGARVYVVIASANRDEQQFERADEFDITRQNNRHLSFGMGAHYCLGAPLARLEGQIAITALLKRMPELRMAVPYSKIRWKPGLILRGVKALPVEF